MKFILELNDRAKSGIRKTFISKTIKETLARTGHQYPESINISVSVAVVSEEEIKELNRIYRKKNQPTDILSFPEYESSRELEENISAARGDVFLGELVLCYNDIVKYCHKNKVDVQEETARVISHGTLHLLGFRHGKKMFQLQDAVAQEIKN